MASLTFYRQERMDGGVRTGISVEDNIVLTSFADGTADYDPSLRWFVDVRCEVPAAIDPEGAREWLLQNAGVIKSGLEELADKLRAGLDINAWPVQHQVMSAPAGSSITLVCSAVRRLDARQIADVLRSVGEHFPDYVKSLESRETVEN